MEAGQILMQCASLLLSIHAHVEAWADERIFGRTDVGA